MATQKNIDLVTKSNQLNQFDADFAKSVLKRHIEDELKQGNKLTMKDIAEKSGLKENFIQRFLAGKQDKPREANLKLLYSYLGLGKDDTLSEGAMDTIGLIQQFDKLLSYEAKEAINAYLKFIISQSTGYAPSEFTDTKDKLTEMYPDQWQFGLRGLCDYVTMNNPELKWNRMAVSRQRPVQFGTETTEDFEIYSRGHIDNFTTPSGSDRILMKALIKEFPSGGVFDYSKEKLKRDIYIKPGIWSLVAHVRLPYGQSVSMRLQSQDQYTHDDWRLLLSTMQSYLSDQGYELQPSSQKYYNGA